MRCLFCGSDQSAVIDKRAVKSSGEIRRRRECLKCSKRFTTYERAAFVEFYVLKREGRKEVFDPLKLKKGIEKALEKRPSLNQAQEIAERIERKLRAKGEMEIESKLIGKEVLLELKKLDKVAYLRFVSVYRNFNEPIDFAKELQSLS